METVSICAGALIMLLFFACLYLFGRLKSAQMVNDNLLKINGELHDAMSKNNEQCVAVIAREKAFFNKPIHVVVTDHQIADMAQRIIDCLPDTTGKIVKKPLMN